MEELEIMIDEEADKQGVQAGNAGTLRCSADTEGNADDDEQRKNQCRQTAEECILSHKLLVGVIYNAVAVNVTVKDNRSNLVND